MVSFVVLVTNFVGFKGINQAYQPLMYRSYPLCEPYNIMLYLLSFSQISSCRVIFILYGNYRISCASFCESFLFQWTIFIFFSSWSSTVVALKNKLILYHFWVLLGTDYGFQILDIDISTGKFGISFNCCTCSSDNGYRF